MLPLLPQKTTQSDEWLPNSGYIKCMGLHANFISSSRSVGPHLVVVIIIALIGCSKGQILVMKKFIVSWFVYILTKFENLFYTFWEWFQLLSALVAAFADIVLSDANELKNLNDLIPKSRKGRGGLSGGKSVVVIPTAEGVTQNILRFSYVYKFYPLYFPVLSENSSENLHHSRCGKI